ncbi:Adenosylcobinamide-phosphate guanylyltransferase [Ancylobacter novellus DSM 506]|uniref:Bifunctional adenosylcobalamin biosynthesis protein n=1 Tax=Ancylobacter novellus (strain ATCC 8093 / DSM 506 / JCM 20403 / CCM 1077 / IAM 12100 / NBRC 12443 / NCIMB 10456) TaxID=639283 RepID=D7A4K8_ANCN5|nr:bifunctional adenosylcobinamide kinase/adenosylcobinamide-phosphate guanylyltransferase [Ancylobacter novellus]ADH89871.1 Adenosylcobinamide-phosphate guanylyltransferase [Ancylobacter novellus DSM 506]
MALTLVLGGARSGKSRHAEELVEHLPGPWSYIATAEAYDEEMGERIALHRSRRGMSWQTLDAPHELAGALKGLPAGRPVLVDCLTLWLTNRMLAEADVEAESAVLAEALAARDGETIVVSNEVGLSIVPENALARRFRDAQGRLNQMVAARAGTVIFMVAGLPMRVKG